MPPTAVFSQAERDGATGKLLLKFSKQSFQMCLRAVPVHLLGFLSFLGISPSAAMVWKGKQPSTRGTHPAIRTPLLERCQGHYALGAPESHQVALLGSEVVLQRWGPRMECGSVLRAGLACTRPPEDDG